MMGHFISEINKLWWYRKLVWIRIPIETGKRCIKKVSLVCINIFFTVEMNVIWLLFTSPCTYVMGILDTLRAFGRYIVEQLSTSTQLMIFFNLTLYPVYRRVCRGKVVARPFLITCRPIFETLPFYVTELFEAVVEQHHKRVNVKATDVCSIPTRGNVIFTTVHLPLSYGHANKH